MILQQKLEEAQMSRSKLDVNSIPKKCYKCNECQRFDSLSSDRDICLVCGHNEGEHEQVRSFNLLYIVLYLKLILFV